MRVARVDRRVQRRLGIHGRAEVCGQFNQVQAGIGDQTGKRDEYEVRREAAGT
jgi:hypothetical protein